MSLQVPQISIRTMLLSIIATLNVLIAVLVGSGVYNSWVKFKEAEELQEVSVSVNLLYRANKFLSLERAASLSLMYADAETAALLKQDADTSRQESENAIHRAFGQMSRKNLSQELTGLLLQAARQRDNLRRLRAQLDAALSKAPEEREEGLPDRLFDAETALTMTLRDIIIAYDRPLRAVDATVTQQMMFKYFIWEITEYAGREYATIGRLIAENKPITPAIQQNLMKWRSLIEHGWDTTHQFTAGSGLDATLKPFMDEAETHYFVTFDQIKDVFYAPDVVSAGASYPLSIGMWLELASQAVESLLTLKDRALEETQEQVNLIEKNARRDIALNAILFVCALSISLYCLAIIILRVIKPVNAMVDALYRAAQKEPHAAFHGGPHQDEIGKLEEVLAAFRENTVKIEQSNEELERYAYIAAHDLKSPLRAIDNLSLWIEEDLGSTLTGKTREYMATLRKRVQRMEKLLDDTLEYSRVGKLLPAEGADVINGCSMIEDAVALASPPKGFTINIGPGFSNIELPRLPLQQVFYNLINNAIKHSDKPVGTIDVGVQEEAGRYVFSVQDDGPGIPAQYHEKVFEMFQTLKPRDEKEGSGMGLAIVKKILTTYGGGITLISEPGKGCLFRFIWPKGI